MDKTTQFAPDTERKGTPIVPSAAAPAWNAYYGAPAAASTESPAFEAPTSTASAGQDTTIYINHESTSPTAPAAAPAPTSQVINQTPVMEPGAPAQAQAQAQATTIADIPGMQAQREREAAAAGPRIGQAEIDTPERIATVTQKTINWNGVVKGALIVTAVVVAAAVAFTAIPALASWAMGFHAVNSTVAVTANLAHPIIATVGSGLHWVAGFAPNILPAIGGMFTHLFGALGIGGVSAAGVAPTIAVTAGHTGIGALALGGTVGVGTVIATQHFDHTHLIDQTQAQIPVHDHPITTAADTHPSEGFIPNMLAGKTSALTSHHMNEASQDAAELGHHSMHEHEPQHHSIAEHHDNHSNDDTPDMPDNDGKLRRAPTRSWRERLTGSSNSYQNALQSNNGSYSAAVESTRSGQPAIAPRGSDFAQALNADRARLDAALGESAR